MKKVKISEATNLQLDWMVAKAEGHIFVDVHGRGACRFPGVQTKNKRGGYELMPLRLQSTMKTAADADYPGVFFRDTRYWCPSTDWAQGGPIIGRERVNIQFCQDLRDRKGLYIHASAHTNVHHGYWRGDHDHPLIAAMRCYVASKLGDEVEVPEELT